MAEADDVLCPFAPGCPFFNMDDHTAADRVLVDLYCRGGFERCELHLRLASNRFPLDNMWPDGQLKSSRERDYGHVIGRRLVAAGAITNEQLHAINSVQDAGDGRTFGEIALALGYVDEDAILRFILGWEESSR